MTKLLVIALSGTGRGGRGDLNNIQHKAIQNCHNKSSPMYNKYMIIKMKKIEVFLATNCLSLPSYE
jgi:hypothetical protein